MSLFGFFPVCVHKAHLSIVEEKKPSSGQYVSIARKETKEWLTFTSDNAKILSLIHTVWKSSKMSHSTTTLDLNQNRSKISRWKCIYNKVMKNEIFYDFSTLCITSICRWVHCAKQWWNSMTLATILCPTFEKCHHYYCSRDRGSAETSIGSLMSCKNYLENELIIYWMMARH